MRSLALFVILALALLAGCATQSSFPVPQANAAPPTPAPVAAPRADEPTVDPGLLAKAISDFTAAKASAQAFADRQTDPNVRKLAEDRVLCYGTILAHLNGISPPSAGGEAAGFFDAQERALQFHDVLLTSSGVVPLDVRVNCAATAAQVTAATTTFFAKILATVTTLGVH